MNVLQAIRYIIRSWDEVTKETIYNCWHHTDILSDNVNFNIIHETDDPILDELSDTLGTLCLFNVMNVKEFLNYPEEDTVYKVFDDDQIIVGLVDIFKKRPNESDDLDEMDDNNELVVINTNVALKSLETVHTFLLQ